LKARAAIVCDGDVRTPAPPAPHCAYAEALDWYTVTGSAGIRLHDPRDHEAVHALLTGVLHRPHG